MPKQPVQNPRVRRPYRREIPAAIVKMLGKRLDKDISRQTGLSMATIWKYRKRLGIARHPRPGKLKGHTQEARRKEFVAAGAGVAADTVVARKLGMTRERVRQLRVIWGIEKRPTKNKTKAAGER
jgi:hypothetical protein